MSEEMFDEMLNDVYPEYSFGWVKFTPSQILKDCDPIAYRIALAEFEEDEENDN
jgi:hypothetical protein